MKAYWKGNLSLGKVAFPVRLYNAERSEKPAFRFTHELDGSPVERVYRCLHEEEVIGYDELVRVVERDDGKLIPMGQHELAMAASEPTKIINVNQFAEAGSIPPQHYKRPYYIVPDKNGERAYALLREVLERTKKVAIARYVAQAREHLASIGVYQDLLMLYQLRFADEIVPRSDIKSPALIKPNPREIKTLTQLVDLYSGPLYIQDYHDEQAERVRQLIERKVKSLSIPRFHALKKAGNDTLLPLLNSELKEQLASS